MVQGTMTWHDRYAVIDGPEGTHAVTAPEQRMVAQDLRRQHEHFWCSISAGGCGGALILKAGPVRTPHFAHLAGQGVGCASSTDRERLVAGYEHLALQLALQEWLNSLGYEVQLEHRIVKGRLDVHALVNGTSHALEVQRSPLSQDEWKRRDGRYRSQTSTTTWLWDTARSSEAELTLATHGLAFYLKVERDLTVRLGTLWANDDGTVGVGWDFLNECHLDAEGLWTPHRAFAVEATQDWRRSIEEAKQAHIRAVRGAPDSRQANASRTPPQEATRYRGGSQRQQGLRLSVRQDAHALSRRRRLCPDLDGWEPTGGWGWLEALPPELHESARHLAYFVFRLVSSGPATDLEWTDVPDTNGRQREVLLREGFITITGDGRKWKRGPRG